MLPGAETLKNEEKQRKKKILKLWEAILTIGNCNYQICENVHSAVRPPSGPRDSPKC